ncbi:hypothetical protein BH20VER3_BH20VER3_11510 [soil metagenome]
MNKRKTSPRKKSAARTRPKKPVVRRSSRKRKAPRPEIRPALLPDYITTEEVDLRATPDFAAPPLPGGRLARGTRLKIAPQDWWYVEVERPDTPSGVLRGWISNSVLRGATSLEEKLPIPAGAEEPSLVPLDHAARRKQIAQAIVNFEARRDAQGHLKLYHLPTNDGGGRYEVAGLNDRYHPVEAAKLRDLLNAGRFQEAEDYALEAIAEYTDVVTQWTSVPEIEAYLRDSAFNRGPGGAAKILQIALGVKVDGVVGPETLGALRRAEKDPDKLLRALRGAREQYELRLVGRRGNLWAGLVNRWDNALAFARILPASKVRAKVMPA